MIAIALTLLPRLPVLPLLRLQLGMVILIFFCSCCDDAEEGVDLKDGLSDLLSWQDCEALQLHGFHSIVQYLLA